MAVILLTMATRLILIPLAIKTHRATIMQKKLAPEMERIKADIADQTEQSKAIMKLYSDNGTNPFGGCLPVLVQFPILIGVYQIFIKTTEQLSGLLYPSLTLVLPISYMFLGTNLAEKSIVFAIMAGGLQYLQIAHSPAFQNQPKPKVGTKPDMTASMTSSMKYSLPIVITIVSMSLPSAMALYFMVSSILSILQDLVFKKYFS